MLEPSPTYSALQAIGFATGFALCVLLGSLQWQANRQQKGDEPYLGLWGLSAVWNAANFAQYSLILAGHSIESKAVGIAALIAWAPLCITPTVILWIVCHTLPRDAISRRVVLACSGLSSLALIALLVLAVFAANPALSFRSVVSFEFANAVAHAAICGVIHLRQTQGSIAHVEPHRPRKWALRITVAMLLLFFATAAIALLTDVQRGFVNLIAQALAQQWAIPVAVLVAAFLAESSFADVVLERTLRFIVSMMTAALLVYFALGLTSGLALVMATITGATIIFIAPGLHRSIARFVDKVVLRRPDYDQMAAQFADTLERVATPEDVTALLKRTTHDALQQSARLALPMTVDIPLHHTGDVQLTDALTRRYMQGELGFIRTMATHAARRIDAIALESERRESTLREERLRFEAKRAELSALRAQVDPHFLFNTLNAIADQISTAPRAAEAMTEHLADFFRYTLTRTPDTTATIGQELEFSRLYLAIEAARFGDRLRVQIDHDPAVNELKVPALILQPLVENAVRHGIAPQRQGGAVRVSVQRRDRHIELTVADDGVGMPSGATEEGGIGLHNVRERIRVLYGEKAAVTIATGPDDRGTVVTLRLPIDAH